MRDVTLVFLDKPSEKQVLLAMKKRGFGEGKWNGVGGKLQDGESLEDAAVREAEEEIGVIINPADLRTVAVIDFEFDGKSDFNQRVHTFFTEQWTGEPEESEEMKPQWYAYDAIPYESMWIDDIHWLPRVLAGEKLTARFLFNVDGSEILEMAVNITNEI